ncbi:hypothetical protein BU23DRAFT_549134 [Bimuria novae-zelandiae CBS 107.79]|uniref:Uncharacterized protein n=1 Tax=Bimuria novae-zelandiae CBS 107.79 TaxID=1447943 RepID=A0A6A5VYI9_9PLEO|nr:hypothetical protein BU23DRAFT_549134 [Bimuria novae-zelandiae CBS 107.79]
MSTSQTFQHHQVLHVRDAADQAKFFEIVKGDAGLVKFQQVRKLVLYLDAKQFLLSDDDKLVMALNRLHSIINGASATNPHKLDTIVLIAHGDFLFARFSYSLVSPTQNDAPFARFNDLLRNTLTPAEKKDLAFKVSSREKPIAPALLGPRGIKNVVFDTTPAAPGSLERANSKAPSAKCWNTRFPGFRRVLVLSRYFHITRTTASRPRFLIGRASSCQRHTREAQALIRMPRMHRFRIRMRSMRMMD